MIREFLELGQSQKNVGVVIGQMFSDSKRTKMTQMARTYTDELYILEPKYCVGSQAAPNFSEWDIILGWHVEMVMFYLLCVQGPYSTKNKVTKSYSYGIY